MAFYEQLSNGKPIGEALRLSRMEVEGSNATINTKAGTIEIKDVEDNVSTGTVLSKTVELEKKYESWKVGEVL